MTVNNFADCDCSIAADLVPQSQGCSRAYYNRFAESLRDFARIESASGVVLLAAAVLALIASNTALAPLYDLFLQTPVVVRVGALHLDKPLLLWINDGLMAIFFLVIGAEIKREIIEGELSSVKRAALPALAAVGGMVVPALLYIASAAGSATCSPAGRSPRRPISPSRSPRLSAIGRGVPSSLKVFLLALAIIDDLGAIVIIAIFYTSELSPLALILGGLRSRPHGPDEPPGRAPRGTLCGAGCHPLGAGAEIGRPCHLGRGGNGLRHPAEGQGRGRYLAPENSRAQAASLELLPGHAALRFRQCGIVLSGVSIFQLFHGVAGGIAVGLFIGKQIGVVGFTISRSGSAWARTPEGAGWTGIYGVSLLAGIGFTMSLFIGTLAWDDRHAAEIRLGVLVGSLLSAVAGIAVLSWDRKRSASAP